MENSTDRHLLAKLADAKKSMEILKWRFNSLKVLRETGTGAWSQFEDILEQMAQLKSVTREITQQVIDRKRQADAQRRATDDINLTLQSYLYEKNHYQKEIYFCKSFQTPELDLVLEKANEVGDSSAAREFKNQLNDGKIGKTKYQEMTRYLETTLSERRELAEKLEKEEEVRRAWDTEYKKKLDLLAQLPGLMQKLEDASIPLQEHLDVKIPGNVELNSVDGQYTHPLQNDGLPYVACSDGSQFEQCSMSD